MGKDSNGCLTLLFSGPWENSWTYYDNGNIMIMDILKITNGEG